MAADSTPAKVWPTDIEVNRAEKRMTVRFDNGEAFDYTAEFLRVHSPSAEVQGHSPADRKTIGGKRNVGILGLEEVGNYAVKIIFDDGHDTGLYGWDYLYEIGRKQDELWKTYLAELEAKGLSRGPA